MVHGETYALTPQQIYFCLQIALYALLGMYLWYADVTNVVAKAERPDQMYYMRCDQVFKDWWKTRHPDIPLSPMWLFLHRRTSRTILKAHASGPSPAMRSLSRSSSRTLHMSHVCTTAFSMMSLFYSFIWWTISPLHANLRKRAPSSVTCWTRTGKYPCRHMT
jgi:hypothetical protein